MSQVGEIAPKLLLDEHIWVHLAIILRDQGFDVIHVSEVKLNGLKDEAILQYAADNGRAVLTYNARDFAPLAKQRFELGKQHAGIIISDQLPQGELQKRIEKLLRNLLPNELKNTVRFLQSYKTK
jgi:predicted nuclease of predicted toxin-antitoxin system